MATKTYIFFLTLLQIFNAIKTQLPSGVTIEANQTCTTEDFAPDCTLKCLLFFDDETNNYQVTGGQWLYSDDDTLAETVTIFDGSNCSLNADDGYDCSLYLTNDNSFATTNYYAGYYSCNYKITDTSSGLQYEDYILFKIDENDDGALIGGKCTKTSDCLALDAHCSAKKCACAKPNDISFSDNDDNIACLSAAKEGDPCNTDEQCIAGETLLSGPLACNGQICAPGVKVPLLEPCASDTDCTDNTDNSFCDSDGKCYCTESYSVSTDLKKCEDLSPVSIVRDTSTTSTLSCTATVPSADYKCLEFQWTYKSFRNSSDNATIFDGRSQQISTDGTAYTETLSIENYNSGYYFCQFIFLSDDNVTVEVNAAFQIAATDGVTMGGPCSVSEDCATLNATCPTDSHICACVKDYSVEYNPYPDSPACLSMKAEGDSCNTNTQCIQADESIDCVDSKCTCTGTLTYISEISDNLCIIPAPYGTGCHYDEQCILSHEGTACNNLICGCDADREYSDSTFQCEEVLSGGAIAGIVIACLVGVAAIVILIICLVRK